jgi:hypothetical protein
MNNQRQLCAAKFVAGRAERGDNFPMHTFESIAVWYVYVLVDPRDEEPFYVGKGRGARMHHHEKESFAGVCSEKCNKINDIHAAGLKIIKKQLAFFWEERAALDFERDLISEIGLHRLTNVVPGGGAEQAKQFASRVVCVPSAPLSVVVQRFTPEILLGVARWLSSPDAGKDLTPLRRSIHGMCGVFAKMISCDAEARAVFKQRCETLSLEIMKWQLENAKSH